MEVSHSIPLDFSKLPDLPGVYKFYDKGPNPIYIGKAKSIRKRVRSYFADNKIHHIKTQRMVSHIVAVSYTVVNSEYEALLLEKNLIKNLQPKYNILLRDDKFYPYLCLTNDRFPRLVISYATTPISGKYYGPFTSVQMVKQLLGVIKKLFPFRSCAYNLPSASVEKGKYKLCLDYHLGYCKGPCQALQSEEDYLKDIDQIKELLRNNFGAVKKKLKEEMLSAARLLDYKKAQLFKDKLDALEGYQAKSLITTTLEGDLDVLALVMDEKHIFAGYLHIEQGILCFTQSRIFAKKLDESMDDLLLLILCEMRSCSRSQAKEVCVNLPVSLYMEQFSISMPKIGDKRKLVELALQNAFLAKKDFLCKQPVLKDRANTTLLRLQQDLHLKHLPGIIECFDNSNIQGHCPVAAMVSFKNGRPSKRDYRRFTIKTVTGPDDFASMYEVVYRRYSRLIRENGTLPHLIVIDGGKGQLHAASEALKRAEVYGKVAIIGIAKRLEEIYFPEDTLPLYLDKKSPSLRLLQRIRDEAHRFAITFHRAQRSKHALKSELLNITGIGPATLHKLLQRFHTLQTIASSSLEELADVIGYKKANLLLEYFKNKTPE